MRITKRAVQLQRKKINDELVIMMALVGYDALEQGEAKYHFQNKWYGIRREGKNIIISYWRSGDVIDTVPEKIIIRRINKLVPIQERV